MEFIHELDHPELKGHIKCELPNGIERLKIARECTKIVNEKGEIVDRDQFDQAIKMMEVLKGRIIEIKVKRGKYEFKDFDDLSCDVDGMLVLGQCANKLIEGVKLGKSLNPS